MCEIGDPPKIGGVNRPWLKEINVNGGISFFGGMNAGKQQTNRFRFNPDLTCIIGGSMSGKSTLLDGLRVHAGANLPEDPLTRKQVEERGRHVFAAGTPGIELTCQGADPMAPHIEQWPAQFFAQNELQRLSQTGMQVEGILARLIPEETDGIRERYGHLHELDEQLSDLVRKLGKLDEQHAEAEQSCERAQAAKDQLEAISGAVIGMLRNTGQERQHWTDSKKEIASIVQVLDEVAEAVTEFKFPQIDEVLAEHLDEYLEAKGRSFDGRALAGGLRRIKSFLEQALREARNLDEITSIAVEIKGKMEASLRADAEHILSKSGFDAARLRELGELSRRASFLASYQENLERISEQKERAEELFEQLRKERNAIAGEQRNAFERVANAVAREFGGSIRVRRIDSGDSKLIERFLKDLRQKGITRWWNELEVDGRPSPEELFESSKLSSLGKWGMSTAVQATFRESVTRLKLRELAAIRCPDSFVLELKMDDGTYRQIGELSGGQRVSVLLSLILKSADNRPLVIDQPEDELDNRFLFDAVLPALRRLRGRRQVIVATHNPNMVVNGDADMVIQLDATARHGWVACAGAIEEPEVRSAIVRTVDGGEEAFRLRKRKYGF